VTRAEKHTAASEDCQMKPDLVWAVCSRFLYYERFYLY